jgi:hypothetical protein
MDQLDLFLLQTKIELDEEKNRTDYIEPGRTYSCIEFLTPIGTSFTKSELLEGLQHFFVNNEEVAPIYRSGIIHGHTSNGYCSGPRMCHMYGFWPTAEMNPRFKKIFEHRWKPVYEKWNLHAPT